ncbi:MAG: PAS domain S-box protein [Rivularia sp. (in: Bacteria)]|nr:PAS domain S-box protein [Rivularia sp. MS3]
MHSNAESIDFTCLAGVIDTSPVIVAPETLGIDAIALLRNPGQNTNQNLNAPNLEPVKITGNNQRTDCVLVCENLHLQGILTSSDIIRFILSKNNLNDVKVAEVMTRQVVTLKQSQNNNIFTALELMRQHRIGHLPIVDDLERIVGIVTRESLLQDFDLQALQQWQAQAHNYYDSHKQINFANHLETNFETNILNRIGDAVVGIDSEHRITYLNQAAEKLYNIKLENFLGRQIEEAYNSRWHNDEDEQAACNALSATEAWQGENIHIKNNGEEIFVESSVSVLKDNGGDNIGLIAVIRDISKRKREEIAFRERLQQLETIADNNPVGIYRFIYHTDGNVSIPYASVGYRQLLGLNPVDMSAYPEDVLATIHLDDREQFAQALITASGEQHQSHYIEYRAIDVLGQVKWFGNNFRCSNRKNGDLIVDGVDIDITARKRAEIALQTSEARFRSLVEISSDWVWEINEYGLFTYASPKVLDILGYTPQEILGKTPLDLLPTEEGKRLSEVFNSFIIEKQQFKNLENIKFHKNGHTVIMETSGVPIFDANGYFRGYRGIDRDITERFQAEDRLRTSEECFRVLVTHAPVGIFQTDARGGCLFINPRWSEITGLRQQEASGEGWVQALHPEDKEQVLTAWYDTAATGEEFAMEYRFRTPEGKVNWVVGNAIAIRNQTGKITGYLGTITDITEIKQVELELRESKERYRSVVKSMHEGVVIQQADGTIISCNASAQKILGLSAEQIKGRNCVDPRWRTIHEDGSPFPGETHPAMVVLRTGKPCLYTVMGVYKPNGKLTWILINSEPLFLPGGNLPYRVVTSFSDITRRKEAEEKIKEQAQLLDITTDAILVKDLEETILYCNSSTEHIYGWKKEELIGKTAKELLYEEISPELESALREVIEIGSWQGELHKITKTGQNIIVASRWTLVCDEAGKPESILTVDTDITQTKQLENQFLRTQRLESLGTLASGIAHDLNNMLTPILAIAQLLPFKLNNQDGDCREMLSMLEDSAKRGADLVKQILTFARGNEGKRTVLQIKHLLKEIEQFANRTFTKSIAINRYLPQDLLTVFADPTQMHQVFVNLVVNARDAMPNGGTITISAQNLYVDESYAKMNIEAQVGYYVVVTIADTGIGISPEAIERVFDPFFTTKEVGKGTGLGLSTAIGIIKNHGGFIEVTSELGKGSQFKIYLPSTQDKRIKPAQENIALLGNSEQILIVDDEPAICEIIKTTLESQNFKILTAADGIEAISTYVQNKTAISLVLIDMMMPEMDGATAIATLQQLNPQVKIIAMSGLISTEALAKAAGTGIQGFLAKPFTQYDLLNTINGVLS